MLTTPGIHHVAFVTAHPERTRVFYGDVLGLTEATPAGPFDLLFGDRTASPGTLIGWFADPDGPRGHWGIGGIHHVALGVRDQDAQLRWKRRLTDYGIGVTGPYDRGYFHSIYFQDPDGHILEIATAGPGYEFDEPADQLGERFIRPDPERLRGERDEAAIRERTHPEPVDEIDPAMQLQGIHHVTGITDDLDAAHRLYTEGLGLARVKRTVNQDDGRTRHDFWARYSGTRVAPHSSVTHFGWPDSDYRARAGTGQTHHLAFQAPADTELSEWQRHLASLGYDADPPEDFGRFHALSFRAPDGLLHTLVHTPTDP